MEGAEGALVMVALPFAQAQGRLGSPSHLRRHRPAAQHLSALGQEMRRRRGEQRANEVRASLRAAGVDPDSEAGRRLETLVSLLISSSAFLQLHDIQAVPPDQAMAYASWAISELLAATTREEPRP